MTSRRTILAFFGTAALGFAQQDWKTSTTLPNVDFTGLSKTARDTALSVMRSETCSCGCAMKIAECRMVDPPCGDSKRLADYIVREASEGKSAATIKADLAKFVKQPLPVLDTAVQKIAIDGDPMRGPVSAKVTIVEFSDFQCPFCAAAVGPVKQVLAKYPKDVRLVFKQFPLDTHSQAALAAEAALAAQAQGKFWEMHDKMYANFRTISRGNIFLWAKGLGLDMNRFQSDLESHKYRARVRSEEMQGENAGVEGTPTFYINGKRLNAAFEVATVSPLIVKELKR